MARQSPEYSDWHNSVGFSGMVLFWVRMMNILEGDCNSVERINQYLKIEQEPATSSTGNPPASLALDGHPPASWPASGELDVRNLSASYSKGGPKVLHGLTFHIKSGERVGVVGRTGAGKSSLSLALLRCIETEGEVYYDALDTRKVSLEALRNSITIIPQVPEMISGSLRENLDPFGEHDDAALNDALRAAGLFALQEDAENKTTAKSVNKTTAAKLTLDTHIASGGSSLSVGQRQIVALARALVRRSRVLVLDEDAYVRDRTYASLSDYRTDSIIQSSLRRQLGSDVTLILIAHRLQTVMDADRIIVLDAGKIVEFDTPRALLSRPEGIFAALVREAPDREKLERVTVE
ncbi:P-loop containing nucleoside triphosphate hydrolase protein [Schizophyllum amplum]|uniref:P-loop containing nucleoside triphosphate hydrolase protein n=1 Tax=Schizophyllum amplum TaxID=97359 RepID=A0A550BUR0_9AGAR|nr:P-loop containing nucleoside triphosphate hydrolase protein [Auriculariopsis ampla]